MFLNNYKESKIIFRTKSILKHDVLRVLELNSTW